jgi:hypothetical protein
LAKGSSGLASGGFHFSTLRNRNPPPFTFSRWAIRNSQEWTSAQQTLCPHL